MEEIMAKAFTAEEIANSKILGVVTKGQVVDYLEEAFAGERAQVLLDQLISAIADRLPIFIRPIARFVLSRLLPDALLIALREALTKLGL
jgi:hypothetical protein